jgi:hypothetical protein
MTRKPPQFLRQLDAFCARLNPGLVAVMTVLSIVVVAEIAVKLPPVLDDAMARAAAVSSDVPIFTP